MKNKKHLLATSIAFALLTGTSANVIAQEKSDENNDDVEVIQVKGLRSSLDMAAQIKRNSDKVVDAIVADDIGKFPDTTTAAALQRVPGVQVVTGDNNEIVGPIIRGIGDILTTLDGREIFTGVGRGFSFQDLPAEALAGADVFKSNTADLIEGGVAGVVNLHLRKPMSLDEGLTTAFNTRIFYGDNVEKANYNIGALVSNRWSNEYGDMGALFNLSYSDIDFDRPVSFNCDPRSGTNGPQGGAGAILPTCVGGVSQYGDYQRPQANVALQWVMPSGLELYADGIYTEYKSRWESDFIFSDIFAAESITNLQVTDECGQYRVQGAGFGGTADDPLQELCIGKSATFNNVPGLSSTQAKDSGTDQYLVAFGTRYSTGNWEMDADLSYQRSHTENRTIIVDIGKQIDAVDIVINEDGYGTTMMPGSPLSDPNDFRFANGLFQDLNDAVGEQYAFESNATYFMDSIFSELQMGVRYADRDSVFRANAPGGPAAPGGNRVTTVDSVGLPADFLITSPTDIPYINNGENWVTPDRDFLLDNTDELRRIYGGEPGDPGWEPARNFDANEKTYSAYVQGKYDYELGNGMTVDGLIGLRATRTERSLSGTGLVRPAPTDENPNPAAVPTPVTTDTGETNLLPNFSARVEVTDDVQVRFTAARTLARPAFADLNPGLTYEVPLNANIRPNGSGGNPDLKPQKSNAYDATVEYYFAPSSYIATAVYYRTLKDRTVVEVSPEMIDGIEYNITRPRNAASATLQGVEISGQLFFDSVMEQTPAWLNGFGVMANFTLADSEITTAGDPLEGEPLQGVSKHSYTAGLLYENHGVTGRLVYTYRSEYSEFLIGGALKPEGSGAYFNKVKGNGRLDFSLGYDIDEHLTVSIDGTNLTGETYRSFFGTTAFPHDVRDDERTFGLSIRGSY